jgi:hypothetical protein
MQNDLIDINQREASSKKTPLFNYLSGIIYLTEQYNFVIRS